MFGIWNRVNECCVWWLARQLKICICKFFLRRSRNNWWDRCQLARSCWRVVSYMIRWLWVVSTWELCSCNLRPTCWSKTNDSVVRSFIPVEINFQSVSCDRWQGHKMNNSIHRVWGQQGIQVWISLAPQYGWFSCIAVHFAVQCLCDGWKVLSLEW